MQIVGRPIRSYVCAMPPNATYCLASDRLPNILSVLNILSFKQRLTTLSHHLVGERWHLSENLNAIEA